MKANSEIKTTEKEVVAIRKELGSSELVSYGYNNRSELTNANAVAAVDADYRYSYDFDDIGNRETSSERGTNSVYAANQLNQYTAVDDFIPQFDDDGNQTLIQTSTGIWQVQYNGENRPVLWQCVSTNSPTPNSSTPTLISMSYDRMGRRVTKNAQWFVYNGYLQIANFEHQTSNIELQTFVWDPTEPVATRPLVWNRENFVAHYTHDGNKNVSEVVTADDDIAAHYEYAPFGAITIQRGEVAVFNPWCFFSEHTDVDVAMVSYNFRHYDHCQGRWIEMDPIGEMSGINIYNFLNNSPAIFVDLLGLFGDGYYGDKGADKDKGHRNLGNPENFAGNCTKPDYAKEDRFFKWPLTSPFIAPWLHFQDITESEKELSAAVSACDIEKYQAYAHRMQDYFAHFGQKYRWFLFGHIFDSLFYFLGNYAEPDNPIDYKYDFDEANRRTLSWEGLWRKCCCCKRTGNKYGWVRDARASNLECKSNPNFSPPTIHGPSRKRMPNIVPRAEDIRGAWKRAEIELFPAAGSPGIVFGVRF